MSLVRIYADIINNVSTLAPEYIHIYNTVCGECSSLVSITLPNSVTNIGWKAFARCTRLSGITIP